MKRILIVLMLAVLTPLLSNAAVGDSTWVQAHFDKQLDHYGNFDTTVQFPDGSKSYRKVYMTITLGKYQCPGNPQYCGDWDYTFDSYLMTKTGDTVELGRLITPYANASYARFPWSWKERYVFDVTDYYPLLKDSATIRIAYSGYSWGFTANIKFSFIEGTPTRNVLGVGRLWNGYYSFGAPTSIETKVDNRHLTAPTNAQFAELKFIVSGHGADSINYCSEFCKKYYQVKLNGNIIEQKDIWRDNCGFNHLYPQSGTWIYDRGNWCPGDIVFTNSHKLNGITGGNIYDVDVDFEPYLAYPSTKGYGGYGVFGAVVYYGAFNRNVDATLEDIIAPTNHEMYYRQNPVGDKGIIVVRNTGSTTITSLKIEYSVDGGNVNQYTWNGTIAALDTEVISLPDMYAIRSADTATYHSFNAKIVQVNGSADEDNSNNMLQSSFRVAPRWPMKIVVFMTTNKLAGETSWKILDGLNNIVAQRDGTNANYSYEDTVSFGPGSYRLVVTDNGCDGLSFWQTNTQTGTGQIQVKNTTSPFAFKLPGYFFGDFGCGFTQWFTADWSTAVENIDVQTAGMEVYPNPATDYVNIKFAGIRKMNGMLSLVDAVGRVVLQQACNTAQMQLNTKEIANGVYSVIYRGNEGDVFLQSKLVIAK